VTSAVTDERDEWAARRAGIALERLDDLPAADGPEPRFHLPPAAWTLLLQSRGRGLQSRSTVRSDAGRALRDAGLLSAFGGIAGDGDEIASVVLSGARTTAWLRSARESAIWSSWQLRDRAVIDVRSAATEAGLEEASHQVDVLPAVVARARLLGFHRIRPAWTFEDEDLISIDAVAADRRVLDDGAALPDGAGPVLAHAWSAGPWTEVTLQTADGRTTRTIRAGGAGWLQVEQLPDGLLRLHPVPSGALALQVLTAVERTEGQ
jgi:hypothetical protein